MKPARTYYHFTSDQHLPRILADQRLKPSESNVGSPVAWEAPSGMGVGPDVVWLLDTDTTQGYSHGLDGSAATKNVIRFTVHVPAVRWHDWTPATKMNPDWRDTFIRIGGGDAAADHWFVLPAPIRAIRWSALTDMRTGQALCTECGATDFDPATHIIHTRPATGSRP